MIRLLSFLLILFVLQQPGFCSFKFFHVSDTHIGKTLAGPGGPQTFLADVVERINSAAAGDPEVKFVLVTGDLTEMSRDSSFVRVRSGLDNLTIPYLPVIGNHDIWFRDNIGSGEAWPKGDLRFRDTFGDLLVNSTYASWVTNSSSVFRSVPNPAISGMPSFFMNYQFEFERIVFLVLDWNTRREAIYGGALPIGVLNPFPGGTLEWLTDRLGVLSARDPGTFDRIVLVSHHALHTPEDLLLVYGFENADVLQLRDLFASFPTLLPKMKLNLCGHLHVALDSRPFPDPGGIPDWKEWVAANVEDASRYTLVSYDSTANEFDAEWFEFIDPERQLWWAAVVGAVTALCFVCCIAGVLVALLCWWKKKSRNRIYGDSDGSSDSSS